MELVIWTIIYKKNYIDDYKKGIYIESVKDLNNDGTIIPPKYFALEINTFGNQILIPFKYKDMFEILYCDEQRFTMGDL